MAANDFFQADFLVNPSTFQAGYKDASGQFQSLVSGGLATKYGKARPKFACIGNSISGQAAPGSAAALSYEHVGFMYWALSFSGHPFQPCYVGGRQTLGSGAVIGDGFYGWSGATSASIAADLPNFFAVAGSIDVAFVNCMENDTTLANIASYKAAYDSIIAQCIAAGAKIIYWNQFLPNTGITSASLYWQLVKYMEAKALTVGTLRIVPTFNLWGDSSTANPNPLNTGLFANYTDGTVHPKKGGMWLGKRIADIMALDGFTYGKLVDLPGNGSAGLLPGSSANMVGTGGVFSGGFSGTPATPPSGLTVTNNLVSPTLATANAARWNGRPSLQIDVTAGIQASALNVLQILDGTQASGFAVGDTVQFFMEVVWDSAVTVTGVRSFVLELRGAGTVFNAFSMRHPSSDAYNEDIIQGVPILYATAPLVVPAGTTSLRMLATVGTDAATAIAMRMQVLGFRGVNWTQAEG